MQSFFGDFLVSEFFNSHRRFRSLRGFERNGLWMLKNSIFLKAAKIWGIENV